MTSLTFWLLLGMGLVCWVLGLLLAPYRLARTNAFVVATLLTVSAFIWLAGGCRNLTFYLLALIPAALIAQHAVYLAHMKNPFSNRGRTLAKIDDDFLPSNFNNGLVQARQMSERYFGWSSLSFRFGLPAILILSVIGLFADPLYRASSPEWIWSREFLRGARYGAAGAYVYILLYLTRRNFRHDITSGAAVWAAVNLVLGALLGGVLGLLWRTQGDASGFSSAVVYFAAGLAPKHMASALEEAAKRLTRSPDDKNQAPAARTKPLTSLRGITSTIAERLEEEGIEDVHGMAMADPTRLMRNTSFDQRQIAAWIDEAILMCSLPNQWEKLEAQGVTGAIDLAWYADADDMDAPRTEQPKGADLPRTADLPRSSSAGSGPRTPPAEFFALAGQAQIDPAVLWSSAQRLYWDGQVQLIWVLYQIGAEGVQSNGESTDEPSSSKLAA